MKKITGWRLNVNAGGFDFIDIADYKCHGYKNISKNTRRVYTKMTRNMIKRDAHNEIQSEIE